MIDKTYKIIAILSGIMCLVYGILKALGGDFVYLQAWVAGFAIAFVIFANKA